MRRTNAQTPSLAYPELPDPRYGPGFTEMIEQTRTRLPAITRALAQLVKPPAPERAR
jgi:hypothetical protein